ncbi:MAG: hypothetical protein KC800_26625 [Candidatus Eremiobacteraeota bacterium]|nr:hypothetical protein [Candidatus Eremiobacteraeota bacterium]
MTQEPFQPVRIYYSVANISAVKAKLRSLKCMSEVPDQNCWEWTFEAEAASLRFGVGGYDDVPLARRPIVIGRIRFPSSREMTLQTNSIDRAIEGARFLGPRLGPKVEALRLRVVNRFFAAEEGTPDEFVTMLDRDVTVIDPRLIEAELQNLRTRRELEEYYEERARSESDVPMVEDFPLYLEEETPDFQHLATTLQFRFVRSFEHWQGNTHLTLAAIIRRTVEGQLS